MYSTPTRDPFRDVTSQGLISLQMLFASFISFVVFIFSLFWKFLKFFNSYNVFL